MTNLTVFENKYLSKMEELQKLVQQKKQLDEMEKNVKKELEQAMDEHNIKSIDNEYLKVTRVEASETTSINLKEMQKKEPKLYGALLEDYPQVRKRKAYVRFSVK